MSHPNPPKAEWVHNLQGGVIDGFGAHLMIVDEEEPPYLLIAIPCEKGTAETLIAGLKGVK